MNKKQYNNILFTRENEEQYIRLLFGQPLKILHKDNVKALIFSEGQIFSYVVSKADKISAWVVKNKPSHHDLPYLEKSALLLLEVTGKLRVKRLIETIQYVESSELSLSDFSLDIFIQLDSLLAGKNYRKEWIIEKVTHGKL